MANITLGSIATELGVSVSTVSKVLSGKPNSGVFNHKTKAKIFDAAKKYSYEPLGSAKALVTGRTQNIGFLLSSHTTSGLGNYYFGSVLGEVQKFCKERGYLCVASTYDLSQIENFVMPAKVRRKSVDGIVITGRVQQEVMEKFNALHIPYVLMGHDGNYSLDNIIELDTNTIEKWTLMIGYLYGLGHRRFGMATLASERWIATIKESFELFTKTCDEAVKYDIFSETEWKQNEYDFAHRVAKQWISMEERPTAMIGHFQFCAGFLQVVQERGFKAPRDVSVLAIGDAEICATFYPAISTYEISTSEHSRLATSLLIDLIENRITYDEAVHAAKTYKPKGEIIIRGSTGPMLK